MPVSCHIKIKALHAAGPPYHCFLPFRKSWILNLRFSFRLRHLSTVASMRLRFSSMVSSRVRLYATNGWSQLISSTCAAVCPHRYSYIGTRISPSRKYLGAVSHCRFSAAACAAPYLVLEG